MGKAQSKQLYREGNEMESFEPYLLRPFLY
jgi:hypothetical protein